MENPRPEKVAVVEEVRERLSSANASVVTEYRGLTVTQLAELRKALAAVGDYKIYKNTLVRLAIAGSPYEELTELLTGPTAIAFVNGEISAAAKALRDFARANPALVVKGGLVAGATISTQDLGRLADLPSREVLLARFAGALAAPLQQLAGLLQAMPRNLAYGLSALVEQRRGDEPEAAAPAEAGGAETTEAPADEAQAEAPADASTDEPTAEASAETGASWIAIRATSSGSAPTAEATESESAAEPTEAEAAPETETEPEAEASEEAGAES